jgi:hypothetical protein
VSTILDNQRENGGLFGEIAIELGFVNRNDIDRLLILQKENRDLLGEILVLHGAISKMDMEEELRQFYELKGRNKE